MNENITFRVTDIIGKYQGVILYLRRKIRNKRTLCLKVLLLAVRNITWQKILRSIDKVDDVVENAKNHLGTFDIRLTRNILRTKEISECRAVLRLSVLRSEKSTVIKNVLSMFKTRNLVMIW